MAALRRCCRLEGLAVIRPGAPAVVFAEDALLVPLGQAASPGLYAADRRLIDAAAYRRGWPSLHLPLERRMTTEDPAAHPHAPNDGVDYVYAGHLTGHYGHSLFSFLSRAWFLVRGWGARPRIVVLNERELDFILAIPFMAALLAAIGLSPSDFVIFPTPTRFDRIYVPYPAIEENHFGYRAFAAFCATLGAAITRAPPRPGLPPCFLTKRFLGGGVRKVVNEAALCEHLERRGVEIVAPESLSPEEQIRLFRDRGVIIGMMGSALHTSLFSGPANIVSLNMENLVSANQIIIDRLVGNEHVAVWPDEAVERVMPESGFTHGFRLRDPAKTAEALLRVAETSFTPARRPALAASIFAGGPVFTLALDALSLAWRYQREGWCVREAWGCWSEGPSARLAFPVARDRGSIGCELHLVANVVPGHVAAQRLVVLANGVRVVSTSLDHERIVAFTIPAEIVAAGPLLTIELLTPDAVSLEACHGRGHDQRVRGVGCLCVTLRRPALSAGATPPPLAPLPPDSVDLSLSVTGLPMRLLTFHGTTVFGMNEGRGLHHAAWPTAADPGHELLLGQNAVDGEVRVLGPYGDVIRVEPGHWPGTVTLRRDGRFLCAEGDRAELLASRDEADAWETFLLLHGDEASVLRELVAQHWVFDEGDVAAGQGVRPVLTAGFRLAVGDWPVNLLVARPRAVPRDEPDGWPPRAVLVWSDLDPVDPVCLLRQAG